MAAINKKKQPETPEQYSARIRAEQKKQERKEKGGFIGETKERISDYAKEKKDGVIKNARFAGKKFVNQNPEIAKAIEEGKRKREFFESQYNAFRESAEKLNTPQQLKQGRDENGNYFPESDMEFRRRQQKEDQKSGGKSGLIDATKIHAKNYAAKKADQTKQKVKNYAGAKYNKFKANNPETAKKIEEIKKKAEERAKQIKLLKKKTDAYNKRLQQLKNVSRIAKKRIEDKTKQVLAQAARQAALMTIRILAMVIAALSETIVIILLIVIIFVVIISGIKYGCEQNFLFDAACSTFIGI